MRWAVMVALVLLPWSGASAAHGQNPSAALACTDVATLDLQNRTLHLPGRELEQNELRDGYNDAYAEPWDLPMVHGEATLQVPDGKGTRPGWQAQILIDRMAHPTSSATVRVLVVEVVNLLGPSTWRYVTTFACRDGVLKPVFQFSGEGVSLQHLDGDTLVVHQSIWKPADPHTTPSQRRVVSYRWDGAKETYVRERVRADGAITP